jgi:hypothetical protein
MKIILLRIVPHHPFFGVCRLFFSPSVSRPSDKSTRVSTCRGRTLILAFFQLLWNSVWFLAFFAFLLTLYLGIAQNHRIRIAVA